MLLFIQPISMEHKVCLNVYWNCNCLWYKYVSTVYFFSHVKQYSKCSQKVCILWQLLISTMAMRPIEFRSKFISYSVLYSISFFSKNLCSSADYLLSLNRAKELIEVKLKCCELHTKQIHIIACKTLCLVRKFGRIFTKQNTRRWRIDTYIHMYELSQVLREFGRSAVESKVPLLKELINPSVNFMCMTYM